MELRDRWAGVGWSVTWSPAGGDLYCTEIIWGLIGRGADEIKVQAVVGEFEQLHEQAMLTFIIQVQILSWSLEKIATVSPKQFFSSQLALKIYA